MSEAEEMPVHSSISFLACNSPPRFFLWSGFLDHPFHRTRRQLTKPASRGQATKLLGMIDGQCANAGHWHPRRLNSLPSTLARLMRNFLRFELACGTFLDRPLRIPDPVTQF